MQWFGRYSPNTHKLWYGKREHNYQNFLLQYRKSQLVERLAPIRFQSQQCIIIHHTHNESLEWSSCSGLTATVLLLTRFGMRRGNTTNTIFLIQHLKSQLVEILAPIRFQSKQCIIIHHTHNESLEWSSCSGLAVTFTLLSHFGMRKGNTTSTISPSGT